VIINAAQYYTFRPTNLWAAILVAALLGMVFYFLIVQVERLVVRGQQPIAPGDSA
jgi:ABC-type nitrate/sulfonate/bicarbonate transport system permease component